MDKNLKKFVTDVLKSSGKIAKKHYRSGASAQLKGDGTIVTLADKQIEKHIREQIKKNYPSHSIIGEEFGKKKSKKSKYTWIIDPIDGTSSFAAGRPIFGIMLGLLDGENPILGAVYQPITEELWVGYNGTTTMNGKKVKASNRKFGEKLVIATTSPDLMDEDGLSIWNGLSRIAHNKIYGGDCYNYCLLASGHVDIVYEQNLKPHDYLPLIPILNYAGAKFLIGREADNADLLVYNSEWVLREIML